MAKLFVINYRQHLTDSLKARGEGQITNELKDAQKYVNGLTDGWYDFKTAVEGILQTNRLKMTKDQIDIFDKLITTLNDLLTKR